MSADAPRSRAARRAAEAALVRVVHHYGARPEFVLLGGLVPELLCAGSHVQHAGTTDVDVQVDLEFMCGAVNAARLERALRNAEFEPDAQRIWRWRTTGDGIPTVVKFELLADREDAETGVMIPFARDAAIGAVNLPGTGFASRDTEIRTLTARVGDLARCVEVSVTGLAGFLLAKTAAAYSRCKPKDWYDIAFVLQHNDAGGPQAAARVVRDRFGTELVGSTRTALRELLANFADGQAQGPQAYAEQVCLDHPEMDATTLTADAVVAVDTFYQELFRGP